MEDFKNTLISSITKIISDFDIKDMDCDLDGDAESEKVFTQSVMGILRENDYPSEEVEKIKQQLVLKNIQVIKELSVQDIQFYQALINKLNQAPIYAVSEDQYLNHVEIEKFLFNMEGEIILWGTP